MSFNFSKTQDFVPIKEIQDAGGYGIIVMKDSSLRAVLISNSINLALKSEDEQIATLSQFQNFLNSLDFTCQIVIQSRKYNIKPYLAKLEKIKKEKEGDPLMELQVSEYIKYIERLTQEQNIMHKQFFVVVPYGTSAANTGTGFLNKLVKKGSDTLVSEDLMQRRSQLEQRIQVVISGLSGAGLKVVPLDTESIIEVFFKTFNPSETVNKDLLSKISKK